MQKWCPDAFENPTSVICGRVEDHRAFQPEAAQGTALEDSAVSRFRSESGFTDTQTLLSHLTRKERAQLFELVEQDVSQDYEEREKQLKRDYEERLKKAEHHMQTSIEAISHQLQDALGTQLREMAGTSARLAVQLAEKVIRKTVTWDPEVLARALETTHFKLLENSQLQVSVHPEDEPWLKANETLRENLNITEIQPDRRIERGGCIIKSRSQEWDATIARQLETLTEIVEEAVATWHGSSEPLLPEDDHEPELD